MVGERPEHIDDKMDAEIRELMQGIQTLCAGKGMNVVGPVIEVIFVDMLTEQLQDIKGAGRILKDIAKAIADYYLIQLHTPTEH